MVELPQNEDRQPSQKEPGFLTRIKDSLNLRKMSRGQAVYTIFFLVIVGLMAFLYIYTYLIDETLLTRIIVTWFVIPVKSVGYVGGVPLYFGIMFLQCIVAPIPSELVQVVGGLIFEFWWGAILSLIGIMITAFIGYYIAIKGGAHVIGAAIGEKNVKAMERFIGKYGIWAMIVGRGIPFIPFDFMTYGAGLVKMKKRDFVVGTLIGTVPRSFFYAWIGSSLFPGGVESIIDAWNASSLDFDAKLAEVSGSFNLILTLTILIVLGGFALFQFVILPYMRKKVARDVHQLPPQAPV
ncbi:MAG: DedA family protein [Promethearchaeota archaeon CR_4]|nr:MAG: DedA family protein [Candidatus Lokiarchaeota archaeon CR_4]